MNLADIRNAAFHQADWGPKQSPEAKERMNQFINRAYNLIALEAPFLFFEDILRFATEPDVIPDEADPTAPVNTVTFSPEAAASGITTANSWVVDQDNAGAAGVINWPADRSWDGRVIELKDNNGVWHRNIIRTIWQDSETPAVPAVAATALVEVNGTLGGGMAKTLPGDKIVINQGQPTGGELECSNAGVLPYPPDTFYVQIPQMLPGWLAAYINGPPIEDPIVGGVMSGGGFNDPLGSFTTLFVATTNLQVPPYDNKVVLTAVIPGAAGNSMTVAFVPAVGGGPPDSILLSSATTPVPGPLANFAGGSDGEPAVPGPKHISFWMPWDTVQFGAGPFQYRIYTEEYALPDDVIQVNSTRLWETNNTWPLSVISQYEAEQLNILNTHRDVAKGIPRTMFRRTHYQMPAPAVAPFAEPFTIPSEIGGKRGWVGPEPAGTFEYKITYCWGARDIWFRNPGPHHWGANAIDPVNTLGEKWDAINSNEQWGQQRYREPRWESAPSPVSPQVVTLNAVGNGMKGDLAKIWLPNIEYIQGFYWNLIVRDTGGELIPPATTGTDFERAHAQKSGWFVRIYRRRVVTDFKDYDQLGAVGGPDPSVGVKSGSSFADRILRKIEEDTSFYLLSEVHIDNLNEGFFLDDGQLLPDYHRRLRDTHGYMNVGLYPNPDKRYEVEVRCLRRPRPLTNDTDAPYIHAEACDVLIDRTLQLLYETEGNRPMMKSAKERYERCLITLTKRYGDLRPEAVAVRRRLVRARRGFGIRNPLRGSGGTSLPFP